MTFKDPDVQAPPRTISESECMPHTLVGWVLRGKMSVLFLKCYIECIYSCFTATYIAKLPTVVKRSQSATALIVTTIYYIRTLEGELY
jgi:hypothetical protein